MNLGSFLANSEWWRVFRRYAQFCVVGGSGVVVDMGVLYLLADPRMLGWNLTLSKVIAAEVAILLLTTDCIIAEQPKKEEAGGDHHHHHDHGGGMGGMGMDM